MVRFVIIGVVLAVAFTLYALIDAAMSDASRSRAVPKPVWVVLIVLLPVIGGILWFTVGRGAPQQSRPVVAPDDDPRFTGRSMPAADLDKQMRELEQRLLELDDETFPGEAERGRKGGSGTAAASQSGAAETNGAGASRDRASNGESSDDGDSDGGNTNAATPGAEGPTAAAPGGTDPAAELADGTGADGAGSGGADTGAGAAGADGAGSSGPAGDSTDTTQR